MSGYSYLYIRLLACGKYRTRIPFPEPYTKIAESKMWLRKDIQNWIDLRSAGK